MTRKPLEPFPPSHFAMTYWLIWGVAFLTSFLGYEAFCLVTRHPENTLSAVIWRILKIWVGESITQWSAGDLLGFCAYISIFVIWLPYHFWWGKFRG